MDADVAFYLCALQSLLRSHRERGMERCPMYSGPNSGWSMSELFLNVQSQRARFARRFGSPLILHDERRPVSRCDRDCN